MAVIDMSVRDHVDELARIHVTALCEHHEKDRVLAHVPVVGREHILRSLAEHRVQRELVFARPLRDIEGHRPCARVKIHLMQVRMIVDIRHDAAAVRIVLQVKENTVDLIEHPLFVFMLNAHLITVSLADGTVRIRPLVPDMRMKIMDIVGLSLPDPQNLVHRAL